MVISPRLHIIWKEKTLSTNEDLKSLSGRLGHFSVVSAMTQTGGRGQGNHIWHSAPGENLTFSILLKFDEEHCIEASGQQILTMAASLSVLDFLGRYGLSAGIRKPNDIYLDGKKICGILIENGISGKKMKWSVVGFGININETDFPQELPNPVSLSLAVPGRYDIRECLDVFLGYFSARYDAIWEEPENLEEEYLSRLISL